MLLFKVSRVENRQPLHTNLFQSSDDSEPISGACLSLPIRVVGTQGNQSTGLFLSPNILIQDSINKIVFF